MSVTRSSRWRIISIYLRTRDGPQRLQSAFRTLLSPESLTFPPTPPAATAASAQAQEDKDARRHLCQSLDSTSGT